MVMMDSNEVDQGVVGLYESVRRGWLVFKAGNGATPHGVRLSFIKSPRHRTAGSRLAGGERNHRLTQILGRPGARGAIWDAEVVQYLSHCVLCNSASVQRPSSHYNSGLVAAADQVFLIKR